MLYFNNINENDVTTCDICGNKITFSEAINAGDKVVCSDKCKECAIAEFTRWQNIVDECKMMNDIGYRRDNWAISKRFKKG